MAAPPVISPEVAAREAISLIDHRKDIEMTRTELIELAEKHGHGKEAASTLGSMSALMIDSLAAHASNVDSANGEAVLMAAQKSTRQALLRRELISRPAHNGPRYIVTELGYRIIGLYNLSKQA